MAEMLSSMAARQLRGMILRLVYVNWSKQGERLNTTLIWSVLDREGYRFSPDDVVTMTQDLRDRGYLRFEQIRDSARRVHLFNIELTATGRDLWDKLSSDVAVQVD